MSPTLLRRLLDVERTQGADIRATHLECNRAWPEFAETFNRRNYYSAADLMVQSQRVAREIHAPDDRVMREYELRGYVASFDARGGIDYAD